MSEQSGTAGGDPVLSALDRVADVAEHEAAVQARVATAARTAADERRAGGGDGFGKRVRDVIDLVAGSTERLVGGAAELRRAWAAHLAAQGLSRREIAERLGVTRQRVSVLLGGHGNGAAAAGPPR